MIASSKHSFSSSLAGDPNRLLKLAADAKNLNAGKQIHARLVVASRNDVVSSNSLINLYAKCHRASIARHVFDRMRTRSVVSWSALMAGYMHEGLASEVLGLFTSMLRPGNDRPNEFVLTTVISSCTSSDRVGEGKQSHGFALKSGLAFHQHVKNALVHMYSQCSSLEEALCVSNTVPGCDIVSYNSVLNGLIERGRLSEAVRVLRTMIDERLAWDNATYVTIFGLCSSLRSLRLGLQVHCRVFTTGIESDSYTSCSIMDMYGRSGNLVNAVKLFDRSRLRNVVSWTTIIAAHFRNGFFEESLNLFAKMRLHGFDPNEYTFAVSLQSSACLSALNHGNTIRAYAEKSGFSNHVIVANASVNMYAKSGDIEAANRVFSSTRNRDMLTWNAMVSGFSQHGLGEEALCLFEDMIASGNWPNHVTFVAILATCAHLGLVKRGFDYLTRVMKEFDVKPGIEHHTCVVGLLGRAGRLGEAERYMRSVPIVWDVVAWRTLLNACFVHRNYCLGRRIAEIVVEMDPSDVGTYMLLSNMYAREKRWDEVVEIRKVMRERNVKKEPGVSWVEINGTTHVFVSEDRSHPQCTEIYRKLGDLFIDIRDYLSYDMHYW